MSSKSSDQLPLFAPLTDKSEDRISEFLKRFKEDHNPLPPLFAKAAMRTTAGAPTLENDERLLAYSFLRARNWNVEKALAMADYSVKVRAAMGLDAMQFFPSPLSIRGYDQQDLIHRLQLTPRTEGMCDLVSVCGAMDSLMDTGFHYWDRRGLPVVYWLLGRINVKELVRKGRLVCPVGTDMTDLTKKFASYLVETGWGLCRYQDAVLNQQAPDGIEKGGKIRNFVTIVVDARLLGYKQLYRPAIDILQKTMQHLNTIYADCVHRILVVNCPTMINFAFNIVKASFSDGLQEKIKFYTSDESPAALDRVVGKERVPAFLGGECNCPGGCLASFNARAVYSAEEEDPGDIVTENIKLRAGEKYEKAFDMLRGETVIWEFVSAKNVDVRFSVLFYPKQDGVTFNEAKSRVKVSKNVKKTTREDPVVKMTKLSDGADSYMAAEDGILQLVWDNSKSWVSDKAVQMRVYKSAAIPLNPGQSDD